MATLAPPVLHIPSAPVSAPQLLSLIEQAGLRDFHADTSGWRTEIPGLDPSWKEIISHCWYYADLTSLYEIVTALATGQGIRGVQRRYEPGLVAVIQRVYGLEEARRVVSRRQPCRLRYKMTERELREWLEAAGVQRLVELRAGDLPSPHIRQQHQLLMLSDAITGNYGGSTKTADKYTQGLLEDLVFLAAQQLREAGPLPTLVPSNESLVAVQGALQRVHQALADQGTPGGLQTSAFYDVTLQEDTSTFVAREGRFVLNNHAFTFGRIELRGARVDGRLVFTGDLEHTPARSALTDIMVSSFCVHLLRVTLPDADERLLRQIERTFHPEPWRAALAVLGALDTRAQDDPEAPRLGWRLRMAPNGVAQAEPVRVTHIKRAGVRLAAIDEREARSLAHHDPSDARRLRDYASVSRTPLPNWEGFVAELAGHARVFVVRPGDNASSWVGPVPVVTRRLRLELKAEGDLVRLALPDSRLAWSALRNRLQEDSQDLLRVSLRPDNSAIDCTIVPGPLRPALDALARVEGTFPRSALPELLARVPALAQRVDVGLHESVAATHVPPDPRLHLELERQGAGLRVAARSIPIPGASAWSPGEGPAEVYAATEEGLMTCKRELAAERARWEQTAGVLAPGAPNDSGALQLDTTEDALRAVSRLRELSDVAVTWVGKPVRLHRGVATGLKLKLRRASDWFGIGGRLQVDGGAIELGDALEALRAGSAFIPMKDGEWVELESDLRAALQAVGRALPTDRAGEVHAGPLHAPLIAGLEELGVKIDGVAAWRELVGRLQAAADMPIEVPQGLTVPLRPYQEEGFRWMCRLSHWGAGAVLADDMGLGKTIQAIAWLLHHVSDGPALVICPTSVCGNWLHELERFAPGLDRRLYHGEGRDGALADLRPGAVVVTSFTMATRDVDTLKAVGWANLVIDEAHAIKNAATQRAKAVNSIAAPRRVALTGTPIENHTGELWAVLTAVAPGLLGSQEAFRERFIAAIERDRDADARVALARLIRPFVLRRLKRDVATELPERTEIAVQINLSAGERTLYNGLRDAAVRELEGSDTESPQARMNVLAALTRLRRAACHPKLIDPGVAIESSKLQALYDLLDPLVESGHRALVFSQFTSLLDHVRAGLRARGMRFCYLDGSTPAAQRVTEVATFQAGQAPVFLLSLKAGGVGLNLTAADTVIHLDPWWNPAVEDQATDRAHRIGQTQPVTVYRLVTRGTVEEKILALHGEKRELATSLLEGTGSAGKLGTEELLALMQDAAGGAWEEDALDAAERALELTGSNAAVTGAPVIEAVAEASPGAPVEPAQEPAVGEPQAPAEPASGTGPTTDIGRVLINYERALARKVANKQIGEDTARQYMTKARQIAEVFRALPTAVSVDEWPALVKQDTPGLEEVSKGSLSFMRVVVKGLVSAATGG